MFDILVLVILTTFTWFGKTYLGVRTTLEIDFLSKRENVTKLVPNIFKGIVKKKYPRARKIIQWIERGENIIYSYYVRVQGRIWPNLSKFNACYSKLVSSFDLVKIDQVSDNSKLDYFLGYFFFFNCILISQIGSIAYL